MNRGMPLDRVQWHLDNWAHWMQGLRVGSGYRTHASGGALGYGSRTFDEMVEEADARCAEAVNAAIDDLPTLQQMAIHHIMLASVARTRLDIGDLFTVAKMQLAQVLPTKGIC